MVAGFSQLTPREKYLASQLGHSEITLYDYGEGIIRFWYDLTTTSNIFLPYLPEDQAVYAKRVAKENQHAFWNDGGITLSYDEMIEATLFWENFVKKYPNSQFIQFAKTKYYFYQYHTFFGSENTRWTDDKITEMFEKQALKSLQKLAKINNSDFAKQANHFLLFLNMSQTERDKHYPVSKLDENDSPKYGWEIAREQLEKALKPTVNGIGKYSFANITTCDIFNDYC